MQLKPIIGLAVGIIVGALILNCNTSSGSRPDGFVGDASAQGACCSPPAVSWTVVASGEIGSDRMSPAISVAEYPVVFVHVEKPGAQIQFRPAGADFWSYNATQTISITQLNTARVDVTAQEMRLLTDNPTKYVVLARTPQ